MPNEALAVIIPSANRPATLHDTLKSIMRQRYAPSQIIVSVPGEEHILPETRNIPHIHIVMSEMGLCRQRNRAVKALAPDVDLVAFFDDDIELHEKYLMHIMQLFRERPEIVLADGRPLINIHERGISRSRARRVLAERGESPDRTIADIGPEQIWGCNMVVRRSILTEVHFDERLPLYGYMEDRDFAFQCARRGRLARGNGATFVHLSTTVGRISRKRFGFSQVMNPLYLWKKGNYLSRRNVARQVLQPLLVNAVLALMPWQTVDRRGQLVGNCHALLTALRGRIAPEDILRLTG